MKKLIVANWKMNPQKGSEARSLFRDVKKVAEKLDRVETVICPPLVYLESLGESVDDRSFVLGAQDAFWDHAGAYTGQVSPDMVFNARARYVIVGHSERRAQGDTEEIVAKKIAGILQFPLIPILCVGESARDEEHQYVKGVKHQIASALSGLSAAQVSRVVIAYEPVWAIGEGARACDPSDFSEMAGTIRAALADLSDAATAQKVSVLYGGSVNAENAASFLKGGGANGLLVGRASLDAKAFCEILKVAERAA